MKKVITSAVLVSLLSAGLVLNNRGLEVRNVLDAYTNEARGSLQVKRANEEATNNLSNVKAQISSVLENGKRHIRFVAALDSYLYDEVNFTITANDGTTTKTLVDNEAVNRAYTYIEAGEEVLSASEAFGEGYNYFVAYTINNVPESAWGYTFSATVSAKAEGYSEAVTKSADRVINDMVHDEMLPVEKVDPEIAFNFENGATFITGEELRPEFTVSEGANYESHFYCEAKDLAGEVAEFKTYEELEAGFTYSLVVTVSESANFNYARQFRWFRLKAPSLKVNPEITFNFENGATFKQGAEEKPEFTVSEGADYEVYYYCEAKDLAGEVATFYSYEELEPGFAYSLNVKVKENETYNSGSAWRWFNFVEAKKTPEVSISIENGATLTIGVDAAPTVTVPEGVNYVTYYEVDEVKVSDTLPTTPGTYSFIVETEANDEYNSTRLWRWFRLVEPTTQTVRYEAENCVVDGTKVKVAENAAASNGSMAADINDCGQGLHFVHYSPVAGEFTMEVSYWTGSPNSKHDVFVDGVKQGTVVYTENTGWANGSNKAATKTITVNLKAGYNNVTVIKNGTASDSPAYGGWVQVDYFEIKGGVVYNPSATVDNTLNIRIEAELGNIHSGSTIPVGMGEATNGFIVGEINYAGAGADFKVRVPESGTYELRLVYAKDGGTRNVDINLDGTAYTYALEDYSGQAWNVFNTSNVAATFELEAGTVHNLSVSRALENSNWFCFDAIILTKVA